jgi:hypothetical protein
MTSSEALKRGVAAAKSGASRQRRRHGADCASKERDSSRERQLHRRGRDSLFRMFGERGGGSGRSQGACLQMSTTAS